MSHDDGKDLNDSIRAMANELEGPLGPCPDRAELFQFSLDRERLVPHVSRCPKCKQILVQTASDIAAFVEPQTGSTAEMEKDWLALRPKAIETGKAERGAGRTMLLPTRKPVFMAAALALAAGLAFTWALTTKKQLIQELALRKDAENQKQQLESRLRSPQINFGAYDIYPAGKTVRGPGPQPTVTKISSSPDAPVLLLLNATGQKVYPSYALEIADANGSIKWKSGGLQRDDFQASYHILVPAGFLSPGTYQIRVFGEGDATRAPLADYEIRVTDQRDSPTTEKAAQK
jgi:hypothetical protein